MRTDCKEDNKEQAGVLNNCLDIIITEVIIIITSSLIIIEITLIIINHYISTTIVII